MAIQTERDVEYPITTGNVADARKGVGKVIRWSMVLASISMGAFLTGTGVRDPVQPPAIYYEPHHAQISRYEGREIKVTAKPLAVFPHDRDSKKSGLEIVLELEDGSFLKSVPGTISGFSSYRPDNKPSDENMKSFYSALHREIKSGRGTKITLIGNLNNGVLEAYGAYIGEISFPIVNYNPSKLEIMK